MTTLQMIIAIVLILLSVILTGVILIQKDRSGDISAISGTNQNSFFEKTKQNRDRTRLSNITIILSIIIFVTIVANIVITKLI